MSGSAPWYVEAFREGYLRLYPHRDLAAARREVAFLVEQGLRGRVLDLCCGFGRHTLALQQAGLATTGVDLSPELLAHAATNPELAPIRGRLVRGDARRLPFDARAFDGVANLFSSFGYFGEVGDRDVLREAARVLRPGGLFVLDSMNAERVRATLVPHSRSERDGAVLLETRSLLEDGRLVVKDVELVRGKSSERWREEVRLYDAEELERELLAAGLRPFPAFGDFDGTPATAAAPRRIVLARRV